MAVKVPLKRESGKTKQFGTTDTISGGIIAANSIDKSSLKNFSAFKLLANNTNSVAAPAEHTLQYPGSQSLASSAIHWSGSVAPSTFASATYNWHQIGNMVTVYMQAIYSVGGTAITQVSVDWQSDMPNPFVPANLSGASAELYPMRGYISNGVTGAIVNGNGMLRRNSGDTAYEVFMTFASSTVKDFWITFTYFTS